jgi:hypothetical protein
VSRPTHGRIDVLPVRGCHPLWPAFPDGSGSDQSATGLVPFRSPLLGESRLMSFPPATEMFQFAGFASTLFKGRYRLSGGFPHSEIFGSQGAPPSPKLFAGCHVLHRLSVPRHPPNALTYRSRTSRSPCANTHQMSEDRCQTTDRCSDLRAGHQGIFTHTNTHGRATDVRCQRTDVRRTRHLAPTGPHPLQDP